MAVELIDDDDAAGDIAALHALRRLVGRAATIGVASSTEIDDCLNALGRLRGLIVDWHGEAVVEMLDGKDSGSA
jgi:hypothetical protein